MTKSDAVDAETLELAVGEARGLVPEAAVVAVSAKAGAGLDELRAALARVDVPEAERRGEAREGYRGAVGVARSAVSISGSVRGRRRRVCIRLRSV